MAEMIYICKERDEVHWDDEESTSTLSPYGRAGQEIGLGRTDGGPHCEPIGNISKTQEGVLGD